MLFLSDFRESISDHFVSLLSLDCSTGSDLLDSPSPSLVRALSTLSEALHSLGGVSISILSEASYSLMDSFVGRFVSSISKEMKPQAQTHFDVKFLRLVCEQSSNSSSLIKQIDFSIHLNQDLDSKLSKVVHTSLLQHRLLLAPLFSIKSPLAKSSSSITPRDVSTSLLLAPPSAGKFQHL